MEPISIAQPIICKGKTANKYLEENKNDDYRLRIPMTDEERMETFRALFK